MGYYLRAFCLGPQVPELEEIQTWLREHGSAAVLDDPNHAVEQAHDGEGFYEGTGVILPLGGAASRGI